MAEKNNAADPTGRVFSLLTSAVLIITGIITAIYYAQGINKETWLVVFRLGSAIVIVGVFAVHIVRIAVRPSLLMDSVTLYLAAANAALFVLTAIFVFIELRIRELNPATASDVSAYSYLQVCLQLSLGMAWGGLFVVALNYSFSQHFIRLDRYADLITGKDGLLNELLNHTGNTNKMLLEHLGSTAKTLIENTGENDRLILTSMSANSEKTFELFEIMAGVLQKVVKQQEEQVLAQPQEERVESSKPIAPR